MTLCVVLAAACAALLYLLYRSRMACRRLEAENKTLFDRALKETQRCQDTHRAAYDSLKRVAGAIADLEHVIRQWNDAPEYATAHPEVVHNLADVFAGLRVSLSDWLAFLHGESKSGIGDAMYMRMFGPGMENDRTIRELYKKMGRPVPVRLFYFDRASGRPVLSDTFGSVAGHRAEGGLHGDNC